MVILVNDDDDGDVQEFASGDSSGHGFLHRTGNSGVCFSHRHGGSGESVRHCHGGSREGFRPNGSMGGFRHRYFHQRHSNEGSRDRQGFRHGHDGSWWSSVHRHRSSGGSAVHGSSGGGSVRPYSSKGEGSGRPWSSRAKGEGFVHSHGSKREGFGSFHGSYDRVNTSNGNGNGNGNGYIKGTVSPRRNGGSRSALDLRLESNGDAMVEPEACGERPFDFSVANKIDAPTAVNSHSAVPSSDRKESEKQEASPSSHSSRGAQAALPSCVSLAPLLFPLSQRPQEKGTFPHQDNATVPAIQRRRERAFISCVGGNNRKRPRSSAIRDYPAGCGKSLALSSSLPSPPSLPFSAVNDMKIRSQDKKVLGGDPAPTSNHTGEDGPAEFVRSGSEVAVKNCSKKIGNQISTGGIGEAGPAELVQSAPQAAIRNWGENLGNQSAADHTGEDASAECVQSGLQVAVENSSKKLPSQIPAVASDMGAHTSYPQGNSHLITQEEKKKQEGAFSPLKGPPVRWGAETQAADGPLKIKPWQNRQNGLVAGPSDSSARWHCQGHVAKKSRVQHISETPGHTDTLVPIQITQIAGSMRAKDLVKRSSHKAISRVNYPTGGVAVEICSKKIGNQFSTGGIVESGPAELVQSAPQVAIKNRRENLGNQSTADHTGEDASAECAQSGLQVAVENSSKKLPSQIPAVASDMVVHTYPEGSSHLITQEEKNKQEGAFSPLKGPPMRWGAETQAADGPLKIKPWQNRQNGLVAGPSDSSARWHCQGHVAKKSRVQRISEILGHTDTLVPIQITQIASSMRAKDLVTRLSHKAISRVNYPTTGEIAVEICSKKIGNQFSIGGIVEAGPEELVQSAPQVAIKNRRENLGNQSTADHTGEDASAECVQSGLQVAVENSSKKRPSQIPAVASDMGAHTYPQGNSHLITQEEKKKQEGAFSPLKGPPVRWGAETQAVDGPLKVKPWQNRQNGLVAGPSDSSSRWHCQGHVAKKSRVQHISEIPGHTDTLVPIQSTQIASNMRAKDPVKRLSHKAISRVNYSSQNSRSAGSMMLKDLAKDSCQEAVGVSARSLVKRTLHEFESIRKALVKSRGAARRADLDAAGMLKKKGRCRNMGEKIVGEVPGVEVGDQFSFRIEMLIIGLHRQVQGGIDYIPGARRTNGCPLATSIVASGGYEDDKDGGDTLIYSGQGGNNYKGNRRQQSDQVLVRGNLALSNCMKEKSPVRVIRGTSDPASPSSKLYTYDGLYDVVGFRFESGAAGYGVYHFTLIRRSGQQEVGLSIVKFVGNLKKKGLARPNLLLEDISGGKEKLPLCVVNEVDAEAAPTHFIYIPNIKYPMWFSPVLPQGCDCVGGCFDEKKCICALKNGGELPYNEKGYMIRDKKVVYECGSSCRCSSSCHNRVSQKGLRYQLEVFKTKNRGWGVRSINSIQPGGFICEYTGELLSDAEAEQKIDNDEYLFDLGNNCNPWSAESDLMDMNGSTAVVSVVEDVGYTIDAKDFGNVARFINHSCSPNLFAQNVLYDSDDLRFPHVMLFAMESIPPMRELSYDYNYSIDQVRDGNGNVKVKACYCGAQDCKGRLY